MESDSSTDSETYMGEEEYPYSRRRRFFRPLPCIAGIVTNFFAVLQQYTLVIGRFLPGWAPKGTLHDKHTSMHYE